jgi:D-3-phosphoglycerate dehydrogenase
MVAWASAGDLEGQVVVLTDGRPDWYGDDYAIERDLWAPLRLQVKSGCGASEAGVIDQARAADAIVSLGLRVPLTAEVLDRLDRCRVVVRSGAGVENVAVNAATARGILVCHVPDYCAADVADHAMALVLALVRRVVLLDRYVRAGHWQDPVGQTGPVMRLDRHTLGIVGFGRVGRLVADRLRSMVRRLLVHDPYVSPKAGVAPGVEFVTLDDLLSQSDILSLHVPLNAETYHLVGLAQLKQMKPGALLVNTSRGAVVDENALTKVLTEGRLAGAALDVLEQEPPLADSPLLQLANVIVTPHFAGYSEQAKETLRTRVAEAVVAVMQGQWPAGVLNPTVEPRHPLLGQSPLGGDDEHDE